jgi:hypothetical protein
MAQVAIHRSHRLRKNASATKSPLHLRRHDGPERVLGGQEPETGATWALPVHSRKCYRQGGS